MRHWVKKIPWRVGMTATPVAEAAEDIYSQALLLDDGAALGTRWESFLNRWFTQADFKGHSWELRPGAAQDIGGRLRGLVYRADDTAYLAALPGILDEFVPVPLSGEARGIYDEMREDSVVSELEVAAKNRAVQAGKLAQIASGGLYRGEEKDLVWQNADRLLAVSECVSQLAGDPVIITYQ